MDIISVGQVGENIIVSVAIPKETIRRLCAIPEGEDVSVAMLSEEAVIGILRGDLWNGI